MELLAWAHKWGVPVAALHDLASEPIGTAQSGRSEGEVQQAVRLQASQAGGRLWRNNVGAYQTDVGSWVRYGLANDSKQMNTLLKSSDLIGVQPVLIGPEHVGSTIGQFVAIEVKREGWKFTGKGREMAQLKFGALVQSLGGKFNFKSK